MINNNKQLVEGKKYTFKVGLTSLKGEAWFDDENWYLMADGGNFYPVESCSDIRPEGEPMVRTNSEVFCLLRQIEYNWACQAIGGMSCSRKSTGSFTCARCACIARQSRGSITANPWFNVMQVVPATSAANRSNLPTGDS